jgi:hypothetical protein
VRESIVDSVDRSELVVTSAASSLRYFFRGQALHLLFLVAMLPTAAAFSAGHGDDTVLLGLSARCWFWLCVGEAIVHQVYVWLSWRGQLSWQIFTRLFGRRDFAVYCAGFFTLILLRPLLLGCVAWVDRGSLALADGWATLCGVVLLVPAAATGYSVARYFGMGRAAGGDHFRESYRQLPMVRRGAFRWTPNAMYTLAFFGLWAVAFLCHSHLALVAAIFQHGYIWAHYLSTEQPDMEMLYGDGE